MSVVAPARGDAPAVGRGIGAHLGAALRALAPRLPLAGLALLVALPVVAVLSSLLTPTTDVWAHLWRTRLPGQLRTTVALVVLVAGGSLVLGTTLAWLVSAYRFPGRRVLGWLLALPLAVPGYVAGFVWLDTLNFAGPVQTQWRGWFGDDAWFPEVRSLWVCAAVLVLSLYPYVYLLARAAFREQSAVPIEVARSLGCSRLEAVRRVVLPLARPSLAAGAALVAMETLTDVGTVRLFNVSTVSDGVFRVWFGLGDRQAATELAAVLVGLALVLVLVERRARGRARFDQRGGRDRGVEPVRLGGWRAAAATASVTAVVLVAVGWPLIRLGTWAAEARRTGATATQAGDTWYHLSASLRVAVLAVLACLAAGAVLAVLARRLPGRSTSGLTRAATAGYALPGPVVGIGVLAVLGWVDRGSWLGTVVLVGSMLGLVYGLLVRFLTVSHSSMDASLGKVTPSLTASARTLGAGPWQVARRVELPLARPGLLAAAALVAIDVVKEQPATLILRPVGVDPLPVWVWQATSESAWVEAAVPSLLIVALAAVPLVALLAAMERGREVQW